MVTLLNRVYRTTAILKQKESAQKLLKSFYLIVDSAVER